MRRVAQFIILISLLSCVYGCRGGSGSSQPSGGPTIPGGFLPTKSGPEEAGQRQTMPTLHQPEPTSMLLLGSGMFAIAFYRKNTKKSLKNHNPKF